MKQSRFGLILLLSSGTALACNGDPTSSIREGSPARITATPSVIFLKQGATTFLTVQLVDAQGNQLASSFDASAAGPQATLQRDTTFLQTTNGANLNTTDRFTVTAGDVGKTTITVTAGGATLDVPMTSVPTSVAATFSNPAPPPNEELTITLPSGYTFLDNVSVVTGASDTGFVRSISPDRTSANVLLAPGDTTPVTVGGVQADFLPGVSLNLPTVDRVVVGPIAPQSGTGATATAPTIAVSAPGEPLGAFYDGGTFDYAATIATLGGPARLYKFTITTGGDYNVSLNWPTGEDMGVYYFLTDGVTPVGAAADAGFDGVHPEKSTSTFVPGTYFLAVVNFSATNPPYFSVEFGPAP